jgi:hypothetical protein
MKGPERGRRRHLSTGLLNLIHHGDKPRSALITHPSLPRLRRTKTAYDDRTGSDRVFDCRTPRHNVPTFIQDWTAGNLILGIDPHE